MLSYSTAIVPSISDALAWELSHIKCSFNSSFFQTGGGRGPQAIQKFNFKISNSLGGGGVSDLFWKKPELKLYILKEPVSSLQPTAPPPSRGVSCPLPHHCLQEPPCPSFYNRSAVSYGRCMGRQQLSGDSFLLLQKFHFIDKKTGFFFIICFYIGQEKTCAVLIKS